MTRTAPPGSLPALQRVAQTDPARPVLIHHEALAYGASVQLVHQRTDLSEAERHDREHDDLLHQTLRLPNLPPDARELIQRAMAADQHEDVAIYQRASSRRDRAHDCTREIAGSVERCLTGRSRSRS